MTLTLRRATALATGALALTPAGALAQAPASPVNFVVQRGETNTVRASTFRGNDVLTVVRGGAAIASTPTSAAAAVALQAGDVLTVSRDGAEIRRTTFDGRPTIDPGFCGGAGQVTGDVTPGAQLSVGVRNNGTENPYAGGGRISASTSVVGGRYTATFSRPVPAGFGIFVASFVPDGAGGGINSILSGRVGPCPVQAQAPSVTAPKDTTPPRGSLPKGKLVPGRLAGLFSAKGVTTTVTVAEAGTVVEQTVFADNGAKFGAAKAKKPGKGKAKPLVVLAKGKAVAKKAGTVTLRLKATKGAKAFRKRRTLKVAVVTKLTDPAGNVTRLPVKRQTLTR